MKNLSQRQQQIYKYIEYCIEHYGRSPSQQEILDYLQWKKSSRSLLYKYLNVLENKGYIQRSHGGRKIEIVYDQDDELIEALHVAILGETSAGDATAFAEENKIGEIHVDRRLVKSKDYSNLFALKIQGDSMDKKKLNDTPLGNNNFAIVDKTNEVQNGDVVLTIIDNFATIKTFKRTSHNIILYPESTNPAHMPIYLDEHADFLIQGKVIAALENPS